MIGKKRDISRDAWIICYYTLSITDEEWNAFQESIKEAGDVQFKYRNSTIFAEVL